MGLLGIGRSNPIPRAVRRAWSDVFAELHAARLDSSDGAALQHFHNAAERLRVLREQVSYPAAAQHDILQAIIDLDERTATYASAFEQAVRSTAHIADGHSHLQNFSLSAPPDALAAPVDDLLPTLGHIADAAQAFHTVPIVRNPKKQLKRAEAGAQTALDHLRAGADAGVDAAGDAQRAWLGSIADAYHLMHDNVRGKHAMAISVEALREGLTDAKQPLIDTLRVAAIDAAAAAQPNAPRMSLAELQALRPQLAEAGDLLGSVYTPSLTTMSRLAAIDDPTIRKFTLAGMMRPAGETYQTTRQAQLALEAELVASLTARSPANRAVVVDGLSTAGHDANVAAWGPLLTDLAAGRSRVDADMFIAMIESPRVPRQIRDDLNLMLVTDGSQLSQLPRGHATARVQKWAAETLGQARRAQLRDSAGPDLAELREAASAHPSIRDLPPAQARAIIELAGDTGELPAGLASIPGKAWAELTGTNAIRERIVFPETWIAEAVQAIRRDPAILSFSGSEHLEDIARAEAFPHASLPTDAVRSLLHGDATPLEVRTLVSTKAGRQELPAVVRGHAEWPDAIARAVRLEADAALELPALQEAGREVGASFGPADLLSQAQQDQVRRLADLIDRVGTQRTYGDQGKAVKAAIAQADQLADDVSIPAAIRLNAADAALELRMVNSEHDALRRTYASVRPKDATIALHSFRRTGPARVESLRSATEPTGGPAARERIELSRLREQQELREAALRSLDPQITARRVAETR